MNENFFDKNEFKPKNRFRFNIRRPKKCQKKNKFIKKTILVLGIFVLIFGSLFAWYLYTDEIRLINFGNIIENVKPKASEFIFEESDEEMGALSAQQVYEKTCKSVVGIAVYGSGSAFSEPCGQGSGIIISKDGLIATNAHVVRASSRSSITVVFKEGEKSEEILAKIVGIDKKTDLALIKVEKTGLVPAKFGDSSKLKTGATVYALGNPGGLSFYSSFTRGIISAVNRSIDKSEVKYIQTDAAINPGNSGGALVDSFGNVVGMNTGKIQSVEFEGMGFAIPSNTIKSVCTDLNKFGYIKNRGMLGFIGKEISQVQALLSGTQPGILIIDINQQSDMNSKGIKPNDMIVEINGKPALSFEVVTNEIAKKKVGEEVLLSIVRIPSRFSAEDPKKFEAKVRIIEDKGELNSGR